ncbi:MAG: hypothetical protein JSU92_05115 [Deltaproteobacteria bacterium]|nr:MAG: hypothetical protein JSU92_05115 [Deltaproteobacteria bacterium]
MIERIIKKINLKEKRGDFAYWLAKPPKERITAVEILRRQFSGGTERFQRVIRVIQLSATGPPSAGS